jgi:hypothetical protein
MFENSGKMVYTDCINGHFLWDIDPRMCDPAYSCDEDYSSEDENPSSRRARKKRAKKCCALKIVYLDDSDSNSDAQPKIVQIHKTNP